MLSVSVSLEGNMSLASELYFRVLGNDVLGYHQLITPTVLEDMSADVLIRLHEDGLPLAFREIQPEYVSIMKMLTVEQRRVPLFLGSAMHAIADSLHNNL